MVIFSRSRNQTLIRGASRSLSYPRSVLQLLNIHFFLVAHGSEIPYVYGAPQLLGASPASTLSTQMLDYWLSFAVAGNPNDGRGSSSKPSLFDRCRRF